MRQKLAFFFLLFALGALLAHAQSVQNPRGYPIDILADSFGYEQEDVDADLDSIYQGCAFRDCIRSVDEPDYYIASAVDFLDDTDLLLVLEFRNELRAYPTRFLDQHEIVNDVFTGVPVAVTYCPLCGSGLAFQRELHGEAVQFGVSGLLHNNDLIMYDRSTFSLWQQITGTAIAGPERGNTLEALPVSMVEWGEWKDSAPRGKVLAPPEEDIEYKQKTYGDYDESDRLLFPVKLEDARLHRKKVVYGVRVGEQAIAVDAQWLAESGTWSHQLEDGLLVMEQSPAGILSTTLDGEPLAAHRMFWFAWYSFNPQTALIDGSE